MREYTYSEHTYKIRAKEALMEIFNQNPDKVFYTNQLAVMNEGQFFHWITSHALAELKEENKITMFQDVIDSKTYNFYFNKKLRYYRTPLKKLTSTIKVLYNVETSHTIGYHLERLVTNSFFKLGFNCKGIHTNEFNSKKWEETSHNLDFIIEKDGVTYGIECKNTIPYIDKKEFDIKIKICKYLNIRPVFAVRYLPTSWVNELYENGGFAWIFKYQLYPKYLINNLQDIEQDLNLPLKICEELWDKTNNRFLRNHNKVLENQK